MTSNKCATQGVRIFAAAQRCPYKLATADLRRDGKECVHQAHADGDAPLVPKQAGRAKSRVHRVNNDSRVRVAESFVESARKEDVKYCICS